MSTRPKALTMLLLALVLVPLSACRKPGGEGGASNAPAPRTPAEASVPQAPESAAVAAPGEAPVKPPVPLDELAPGYRLQDTVLPPGTVARVGGQEIFAGTLKTLSKVLRSGGSSGHQDPSAVRTAALLMSLDQLVSSKKLTKGKYAQDPRVRRVAELYRLLYLGKRYEREKISPRVTVSEAELAARLPASRDELKVRLLILNPLQEQAIRDAFAAGTPFDELVAKYSLTGGGAGMGEFGWQRRGQTIFSAAGDEALWKTKQGQISPVLETAIGSALAQVVERRAISDAEWEQATATVRGQVAGQRGALYTNAIIQRHKIEPVFEGVRRIAEAMAAEDRSADALVGRVDAVEVWFHDLDRMMDVSYQDVMLGATAEQIRNAYLGFFDRVAAGVALGLEARAVGVKLAPEDEAAIAASVAQASLKVAIQDILKGVSVDAAEVAKYYREHAGRFSGVSAARLQVVVVKDMATALEVAERFRSGANFTELVAKYSIDTATQARGGDLGLQGADRLPPEVMAGLLQTAEGELLPIYESGGSFSVALLREKRQTAPLSEAEAKVSITRNLLKRKRSEAVREYLVALRGGDEVEFDRAQFEALPLEKQVAMPSQHGGSHGMPGRGAMPPGHPGPAGGSRGGGGGMPAGHPSTGGGQR